MLYTKRKEAEVEKIQWRLLRYLKSTLTSHKFLTRNKFYAHNAILIKFIKKS